MKFGASTDSVLDKRDDLGGAVSGAGNTVDSTVGSTVGSTVPAAVSGMFNFAGEIWGEND